MKKEIINKLTNTIVEIFGEEHRALVEINKITKTHINADFYSNIAMKLAKSLKQNPEKIAIEIADKFLDFEGVVVSVAKPGYINFRIDKNLKNNIVIEIALEKDLISYFKVNNPKNSFRICLS